MDTRTKIIEGAAELFRKYGIRAVTMDMIATHLSVSKRTIYEIFSDRDELLAGVLNFMAQKQREIIARVLEEEKDVISAIFKIIKFNLEHIQSMNPAFNEDLKRIHLELKAKGEVKCEMPDYRENQKVIERGIKEKLFRKDINPDIVTRSLYIMFLFVMNNDFFPYELFSRREVIKNSIVNYLKGISTPEGVKLITKLEKKL